MAISEDTAALVAAQLTVAWAQRAGVGRPDPAKPFIAEVADVYVRYREAVREVDVSKTFDMRKML